MFYISMGKSLLLLISPPICHMALGKDGTFGHLSTCLLIYLPV